MKRFQRLPKKFLPVGAAVILFAAAFGATLAYFTAKTNAQENAFKPGVTDVAVSESGGSSGENGRTYTLSSGGNTAPKAVSITNVNHDESSVPVYVRVRLVPIVRDADRNGTGDPVTVLTGPEESATSSPDGGIRVFYELDTDQKWTSELDGFYYYKAVLKPGENTAQLLKSVEVYGLPPNKKLEIQVIADSIQTVAGAEQSAWGRSFGGGNWSKVGS